MSNEIRAMWPRFDELAAKAESPDFRLLIEAIKLQTEMMNLRLGQIEMAAGALVRQTVANAANPAR